MYFEECFVFLMWIKFYLIIFFGLKKKDKVAAPHRYVTWHDMTWYDEIFPHMENLLHQVIWLLFSR